ncbi:MAG TPA: response regulator transcription factor [Acidimicrobiales bacterium]|nr:response regulator transcription factor [Acidimicrobiales bacterium]
MTRLLLAEDHTVVREALRASLQEAGFEVVGAVGDGVAAVSCALATLPDVVLMDVSLPASDGISATRELTARVPAVRVVVLTMFDDDETRQRAADAGAAGYLVKDCPMSRLVAVVRSVAEGATGLPASSWARGDRGSRRHELTRREIEVLRLAGAGASTAEIARHLFVSARTAKNHLASIYSKLGVRDRTQAVLAGLRLGIVELPGGAAARGGAETRPS